MPDYWKIMSDGFKDGKLLAITRGNLARDMGTTIRFSDTQLQRYAFRIADGRVRHGENGNVASTTHYSAHSKAGIAAFVVGLDDTLYLFNHLNKTDNIAHSSFVGKFAKAAGELVLVEGKITLVHAHSGHFRPNALNMYHIVKYFSDMGVLAPSAKVGFVRNPFAGTDLTPPPYAASVPFLYLLDEHEIRTLRESEQFVFIAQSQAESIRLSLLQTNFQQQRIKDLTEQVQTLRKQLDEQTGSSGTTKFELDLAQDELDDLSGVDNETYRGKLTAQLKELQADIDLQQDLIDALNDRSELLSVVFDAQIFMAFVLENFPALREKIKPAFFDVSL